MVNFSNYLYENLMIDRELKVLLASPINKWSSLLKVDCNFDNFEVKAYSDTDFKEEDNDCDLIICKNSEKIRPDYFFAFLFPKENLLPCFFGKFQKVQR